HSSRTAAGWPRSPAVCGEMCGSARTSLRGSRTRGARVCPPTPRADRSAPALLHAGLVARWPRFKLGSVPVQRRSMPVDMTRARFEEVVGDALDLLPREFASAMNNVVILVEEHHPEDPALLGLYEGVSLTERDHTYAGML